MLCASLLAQQAEREKEGSSHAERPHGQTARARRERVGRGHGPGPPIRQSDYTESSGLRLPRAGSTSRQPADGIVAGGYDERATGGWRRLRKENAQCFSVDHDSRTNRGGALLREAVARRRQDSSPHHDDIVGPAAGTPPLMNRDRERRRHLRSIEAIDQSSV